MLVALFISVLAVAAPAEPKLKKAQSTTAPAAPATIPQVVIVGKRMTDEQKRQWDAKNALQIAGTRPDTLHKK